MRAVDTITTQEVELQASGEQSAATESDGTAAKIMWMDGTSGVKTDTVLSDDLDRQGLVTYDHTGAIPGNFGGSALMEGFDRRY